MPEASFGLTLERVDALRLIEACYEQTADDTRWGCTLATVLSSMLGDWTAGVMFSTYSVDAGGGLQLHTLGGDDRCAALIERFQRAAGGDSAPGPLAFARAVNHCTDRGRFLDRTYGSSSPTVAAISELPRQHQEALRHHLPWPRGDTLGLFCSLDGAGGVQLGTASPSSQRPPARRRAALMQLSEHLAVGYWLRRQRASSPPSAAPEVVAVYAPEGRRLDRVASSGDRTLEASLVDAVRGMDRARCRQRKHAPDETAALWRAFVAGRYALVESFERGGRRVVLAVRCRSPRPALSAREAAVALAAARGLPNKLIGDELGISASTVGVHLRVALRKLGCPSRRLLSTWLQPQTALQRDGAAS